MDQNINYVTHSSYSLLLLYDPQNVVLNSNLLIFTNFLCHVLLKHDTPEFHRKNVQNLFFLRFLRLTIFPRVLAKWSISDWENFGPYISFSFFRKIDHNSIFLNDIFRINVKLNFALILSAGKMGEQRWPLYGLCTAFIWPLYGHYTALIRLLYGHYTAIIIRRLCGFHTAFIRPLYGIYTAIIRLLYGLSRTIIVSPSSLYTAIVRPLNGPFWPLYGHYTAGISIILICISKGLLEQF